MAKAGAKRKGKQTPLMRQYQKIKERHPNALLLFRLGDFYETFEDDAKTVSQVLGITLTKRSNGGASDVPLAGFPHHALDNYLPKLVRAGHRVAICEQLEDPKHARKVVKRGVVEVVTPGVSFHDTLLSPKRANYLAAIHWGSGRQDEGWVGFAFIDASTGEFALTEVPEDRLEEIIQTIAPAEVLIDKRHRERLERLRDTSFVVTPQEDWCFGYDFAYETLLRHFKTHSLKGFGVEEQQLGIVAAGAALYYLGETQKGRVPHVQRLARYQTDDYIALDPQTKRNLELVTSMQDAGRDGSLVSILDETQTPMGGRLLRKWLVRPLRNVKQIEKRLDAVDALVHAPRLRGALREELSEVGDLERLAAKVALSRATPRDLAHLRQSLERIPTLKQVLADEASETLHRLADSLTTCRDIVEQIQSALVDEPPANINDGGFIRDGYNDELDELRGLARSGKDWIARMQAQESERTGIPSLKVGYNKVFGYYLEITNAHKDKVPEDYIRKQTLVNAERYITPELKEYEEKILTAEEKITYLETQLFTALRADLAGHVAPLQLNASLLAMMDCFCAFAFVAERSGFTRPSVGDDLALRIVNGRHPVVEHTLPAGEAFIPNDASLDPASEQILIITGPNMAGKSVALRQVGLIVLMAQVGCFVPADEAHVGVVDRIFTRVGASDNLAAGESTFLVEMNETANILNNASPRSLILLDEVGRGTSTFDGLSIAWAIVEYLHENADVAARTLFATHYHELNELSNRYARVKNFRVQVQEHEGRVIFLRKLVPGGADHSYGIEVARMAGLPEPVIERAQQVLEQLESQHLVVEGGTQEGGSGGDTPSEAQGIEARGDGAVPAARRATVPDIDTASFQMSLFQAATDPALLELRDRLREIDTDRMTPIEALMLLAELRRLADEAKA